MRILGLDLGDKTLGIAMSDPHQMIARGIETFRFPLDDHDAAIEKVLEILKAEPIQTVILGFPKNMDNTIGFQAKKTQVFSDKLKAKTHVPVILWDERLSTKRAQQNMNISKMHKTKRKKTIDQEAAVFILQSYLDSK